MLLDHSATLQEKIRDLRIRRNLTQEELAANIGISNRMVSNYEKGKAVPDDRVLGAIADFFGYDIEYFKDDNCLREEKYLPEAAYMMPVYEGEADKNGDFKYVMSFLADKSVCMGAKTFLWRVTKPIAERYNIAEGTDYLVSDIPIPVHGDKLLVIRNGKTCIVRYEYTDEAGYFNDCENNKRVRIKKSDKICGRIRCSVQILTDKFYR